MTDRPKHRDDEPLDPDAENAEQDDEGEQAQTVAQEALDRATSVLGEDSQKARGGLDDEPDEQDLVDHMNQMETSGTIDMSAYEGEPNHDDNVDKYGKRAKLDGLRGDGT